MPWQPSTPRRARLRAAAALRASPYRSDQLIAGRARCSTTTVARARRQLEADGTIPQVPVSRRQRRPYPRQASRTHAAIVAGARTPREVADAAGVSLQAGWKALRAHREREAIPALPPPPQDCERCGRPFVPVAQQAGAGTGTAPSGAPTPDTGPGTGQHNGTTGRRSSASCRPSRRPS